MTTPDTVSDETLPAEQPQVTPATKFQRRGFKPAAEVIAKSEQRATSSLVPEEQADPEMNAAILADENVAIEFEGQPLTINEVNEEVPAQAEEPAAEPKYKIGGKEFGTQEEAWAYAEELEQERIAADAFRQGVELASKSAQGNPVAASPEPPPPKEIDPEYYTNPQAYFAKREAEIITKAKQATQAELQRQQTHNETWSKFYTEYPDLVSARELVDLTLQQNWDTLQHVKTEVALKSLAEKTRAKLKPMIEARMPKVTLPKVAAAVTPGGARGVTPQKTDGKPLSFVQQHKNLKKNRAQFR